MNTVTNATVMDARLGLTVSMMEVDAAAARAALTDHLRLTASELEQPAVVAVLAAVVAAGWRPPAPAADRRPLGAPAADRGAPTLFGAEPTADSAGISTVGSDPPGRPQ
jgi:hypothetical protein